MKKMNNLAIIGASYLQLPLIQKAKEMGYVTHVFAWAANDVGEKEADYFYPISIVEKDEILEQCRAIGVAGICSIASDLAAVTVNYVAEKLGLCGNSSICVKKSTNKYYMRKAFTEHGDPSPQSRLICEGMKGEDLNLQFPVIVKPTDRSGSRGVCKLESYDNLQSAIEQAQKESFEKKAVVEEFVEGKEYSVEYLSYKGEHHFLAVTEKFTTNAPHYIETGHMEPADLQENVIINIRKIVEHALDSLDIENGASHTEIKIDDRGRIYIIEIGARMGGDCIGSDLVYLSTGIDFVKAVIQVACGLKPDLSVTRKPIAVKIVYILNEDDKQKFEKIQRDAPEKIVKIVDYHPEMIGKVMDSSNRAGCYIVRV